MPEWTDNFLENSRRIKATQVATASGGIHFYIKATGEGNTAGIFPGIDHRGLGGYVVAPPSTLGARGRSWSWTAKPSPVLTGATL